MQARIRRNPGPYGKWVALDVFVNGKKELSLKDQEESVLLLPESHSVVHVEMSGSVRSPRLQLPFGHGFLECGAEDWLLFDVLSFCYLPILRERVFYLRFVPAQRE